MSLRHACIHTLFHYHLLSRHCVEADIRDKFLESKFYDMAWFLCTYSIICCHEACCAVTNRVARIHCIDLTVCNSTLHSSHVCWHFIYHQADVTFESCAVILPVNGWKLFGICNAAAFACSADDYLHISRTSNRCLGKLCFMVMAYVALSQVDFICTNLGTLVHQWGMRLWDYIQV
jgi:hypothetical protein